MEIAAMNIAGTLDFPFVADLPKREQKKMANLWDKLDEMRRVTEDKGMLLSARFVAKLLGVCNQRVSQLMQSGQLERIEVDGHPFITEKSLVVFAQSERKAGRPRKLKDLVVGCVQYADEVRREVRREMKESLKKS